MTGLHPHLGPGIGELVHASVKRTGPMQNIVFKLGAEGLGYYHDCGNCTLALAPLIAADASLPVLPLRLFDLLGLGNPDTPRHPSDPSGNGPRRTRGGKHSRNSKLKRTQANTSAAKVMPLDPCAFVGNDARRADRSHKALGILAYDSVNANAWRQSIRYLEATGADAVFFQETKVPSGQSKGDVEQTARNANWNASLQACSVSSLGGRSGGVALAARSEVGLALPAVSSDEIVGLEP